MEIAIKNVAKELFVSSIDKPDNPERKSHEQPNLALKITSPAVDMRREKDRLSTFKDWPVPFLKKEALAKNGFYYLGRGDEVRCAFCKVEIMRWEEGDDPAKDHARWAPQCPFIQKESIAENVPLTSDATTPVGEDECGARLTPSYVRIPGPSNPQYACKDARLRTFRDWPRSLRQKPEELAEAGFFYTGHGDKTKCFYCDGGLKDWEDDDVPWEQHALWFERCAYVQLVKGREYVQKVNAEANAAPGPIELINSEVPTVNGSAPKVEEKDGEKDKLEEDVDDNKLCKICYEGERNVCLIPCGHVVACAKCALATRNCPVCRRTIENAVRLYYS